MMFENLLRYWAQAEPDRAAMSTPNGDVSYHQLHRMSQQMSRMLRGAGILAGQTVAVSDTRPAVHWALLFALERLGCVSLSAGADLRDAANVQPDWTLCEDNALPPTGRALHIGAGWLDGVLSEPVVDEPDIALQPDQDNTVRLVMTSGSTGLPKVVRLSRSMIDVRMGHFSSSYVPSRARMLSTMGVNSIGGYLVSLAVWSVGGTLVYQTGADTASAVENLQPNFLLMAPVQLQALLNALPTGFVPPSPLRVAVGGSAISRTLVDQAMKRLTTDVVVAYGSTEAGPTTAANMSSLKWETGAVGPVLPWSEIRIIADNGQPCPTGNSGWIEVRAAGMISGYAGNETVGSEIRDGWFRPGDIGRLRDDGCLIVEGRIDDVINVGGVKVSALSLDEIIEAIDGVIDAAAFSYVDETTGEPVLAAAIQHDASTDMESIARAIGPRISLPLRIFGVTGLPRTDLGKIERHRLHLLAHNFGTDKK